MVPSARRRRWASTTSLPWSSTDPAPAARHHHGDPVPGAGPRRAPAAAPTATLNRAERRCAGRSRAPWARRLPGRQEGAHLAGQRRELRRTPAGRLRVLRGAGALAVGAAAGGVLAVGAAAGGARSPWALPQGGLVPSPLAEADAPAARARPGTAPSRASAWARSTMSSLPPGSSWPSLFCVFPRVLTSSASPPAVGSARAARRQSRSSMPAPDAQPRRHGARSGVLGAASFSSRRAADARRSATPATPRTSPTIPLARAAPGVRA